MEPFVISHEDVVVAYSQDDADGWGLAQDGCDNGHWERDEVRSATWDGFWVCLVQRCSEIIVVGEVVALSCDDGYGLVCVFVGVDMGLDVVDLKFGGSVGLWSGGNSSLVGMDCGRVVLNC